MEAYKWVQNQLLSFFIFDLAKKIFDKKILKIMIKTKTFKLFITVPKSPIYIEASSYENGENRRDESSGFNVLAKASPVYGQTRETGQTVPLVEKYSINGQLQ